MCSRWITIIFPATRTASLRIRVSVLPPSGAKNTVKKGYDCAVHRPHLKDFNLDLTEMWKGRTPDDLDRQRESEMQAEFEKNAVEDPAEEHDSEDELSL